uniref:Uncharacterized protein n=1 Tax=Timema genevievae TaxID=629358 RepID=A0A7R9K5W2_TIMGE|nr:unnamed protein product [Timema genevievae]
MTGRSRFNPPQQELAKGCSNISKWALLERSWNEGNGEPRNVNNCVLGGSGVSCDNDVTDRYTWRGVSPGSGPCCVTSQLPFISFKLSMVASIDPLRPSSRSADLGRCHARRKLTGRHASREKSGRDIDHDHEDDV